MKYALIR